MISGPGYVCWIEYQPDGYHIYERAPSFTGSYGPYRWRWVAKLVMWSIEL